MTSFCHSSISCMCLYSVQDRASKLVGLRLEKHMEKIREQYQQQKNEEEERRLFYNSPHIAHRDAEDGGEDQQSNSTPSPSVTPVRTPEHTPESSPYVAPKPAQKPAPKVAPKPAPKQAPKPAPKPAPRPAVSQPNNVNGTQGSPPSSPTHHSRPLPPQQAPYNPYPPPSQPAPPPRVSPPQSTQQVVEHAPVVASPPSPPHAQHTTADQEPLFAFAWYHGSIPRDEAVRRLEAMGNYDG